MATVAAASGGEETAGRADAPDFEKGFVLKQHLARIFLRTRCLH
jgi:hypothetical protein